MAKDIVTQETFRMTEGELSERQQHSSVAGEHAAYQHAVKVLQDEASRLYIQNKDEQANLVRHLAFKLDGFREESSKKLQEHIKRSMKR